MSPADFLLDATLNGSVALFMRCGGLSTHQRAAHHQRCRTGLHEENISLIFVPFGYAIGLPP